MYRREFLAKSKLLALPAILPLYSINLAGRSPHKTKEDGVVKEFFDHLSEVNPKAQLKSLYIMPYTNSKDFRYEIKLVNPPETPYGIVSASGFLCEGHLDIKYIVVQIKLGVEKLLNVKLFHNPIIAITPSQKMIVVGYWYSC